MQIASALNEAQGLIPLNMSLQDRVNEAIQASGKKPVEIARAIGKTPSAISQLMDGTTKSLKADTANGLEAETGYRSSWLVSGKGPKLVGEQPTKPRSLFADEGWAEYPPVRPEKFNYVPVLGQGAGGSMPERVWSDGDFPVGATNEYAEVMSTDPHAFIIKIVGFSMVPKFSPPDYALIEPGTEPDLEDDVLVRLKDGQTLIKKLLSRRGHIKLGSYNDPQVLVYEKEDVTWMYYVAYPVPARKIKSRL